MFNTQIPQQTDIKPSKTDNRDFVYKYAGNIPDLPNVLDYRNLLTKVRNQKRQGSCFAFSVACMKEWQEYNNIGFSGYFSPQFFYNNRSNLYDNNNNNDDGMYARDVMKLLKNIGICEETQYPYGKIETKDKIDQKLYDNAYQYRIKAYARINDLNSLKKSLYLNGPCILVTPMYNHGVEMWNQEKGQTRIGGHAMTIVGYNDIGFIIRNSWGTSWGNRGYCIYKYTDWGKHWEIWTTIDEDTIKSTQKLISKCPGCFCNFTYTL